MGQANCTGIQSQRLDNAEENPSGQALQRAMRQGCPSLGAVTQRSLVKEAS